jgi:DTW domain-containing protein YfiP
MTEREQSDKHWVPSGPGEWYCTECDVDSYDCLCVEEPDKPVPADIPAP